MVGKLLRQIASWIKYVKKRLTFAALCFNRYVLMKFFEKSHFAENLKLADITPVFKKEHKKFS